MKRDWELIRNLLIHIEGANGQHLLSSEISIAPQEKIYYHLDLMIQGELIIGTVSPYMDRIGEVTVVGLTPKGHDFIEQIRSDTVWGKTVGAVREKGLDLSYSTIKSVAATVAANLLKM